MKKIFFICVTVISATLTNAQSSRVFTKHLQATEKLQLKTRSITDFSLNLLGADSLSDAKIPTAKAVADFVRSKSFSGGGGSIDTTGKFIGIGWLPTLAGKQNALVSGTNIKTINGNSVLGSGDLTIGGAGGSQSLEQTNGIGNTSTRRSVIGGNQPNYNRSDTVQVAGYPAITTTAADWGSAQYVWALNFANNQRIRQTCKINVVQIYFASVPVRLTAFYLMIWRERPADAFDSIAKVNILPYVSAGLNTITLPTPINVREGDVVGYGYESSGAGSNFLTLYNNGTTSTYYNNLSTAPTSSNYGWVGQSSLTTNIPIKLFSYESPFAVYIGNSIMSGNNMFSAYANNFLAGDSLQYSIPFIISKHYGWTNQNLGISNYRTIEIRNDFTRNVLATKPRIVIMEGGVNDIGGISSDSTIANYTWMYQQAVAANIKILQLSIFPWTNGSNANNRKRDSLNTRIKNLVQSYGGKFVMMDTVLGQFRSGGDAGNFWDIQTGLSPDGAHFYRNGFFVVSNKIKSYYDTAQFSFSMPAFPDSTGAIGFGNGRDGGIKLPYLNDSTYAIVNNLNTITEGQQFYLKGNTFEGSAIKTSEGLRKNLTTDNLNVGSYAQRIAIAVPKTGQVWHQTDYLIGTYVYDGTQWQANLPVTLFEENFLRGGSNTIGTTIASTLTMTSGGGTNNVNNTSANKLDNSWLFYTGTTPGSGAYIFTGLPFSSMFASNNYVMWQRVRPYLTLSSPSEREIYRYGVGSRTAANSNTYFNGFIYSDSLNGGKWQVVCNNGATIINTDITVDANTTYDLVINFNAVSGSATCFINGTYVGVMATATVFSFDGLISSVYKTTGSTNRGWYIARHRLYKY